MGFTRRQFFGMTAGALVAAGLPLTLLPQRTIILPPVSGWYPDLRMREVEQYVISTDSMMTRYAMAWMVGDEKVQWHVDFYSDYSDAWPRAGLHLHRDRTREIARSRFAEIVSQHGLQNAKAVRLPLPPAACRACYT